MENVFPKYSNYVLLASFFHIVVQYDISPKGKILYVPLEYRLKASDSVYLCQVLACFLALEKNRTGWFLERYTHESLEKGKRSPVGSCVTGSLVYSPGSVQIVNFVPSLSLNLTWLWGGSKPREYMKTVFKIWHVIPYYGHQSLSVNVSVVQRRSNATF